jgi:ABC-type uncharacterized transport system permease subunit
MIDFALYLSYFLILVAIVAALAFPLKYLFQHVSEAKETFIGVGIMMVIVAIGYLFASSEYSFKGMEAFNISKGTVKFVGGGLNTFFIMFGIAIGATIYFEVSKLFK